MRLSRNGLYRAEIVASVASACLFVLTIFDPIWIERWFGELPDGGDGSAERWWVGGGFLVAALLAAVLAAVLAQRERRSTVMLSAAPTADGV